MFTSTKTNIAFMNREEIFKKGFSGIILAGGRSRRMKRDKSEIKIGDKTFLEIQIEKLKMLGASEILISGKTVQFSGVKNVSDIIPDCGPLGGLYSCFANCSCDDALVLCVDSPLLSITTLKELLFTHQSSLKDATILSHNGVTEPLIAVYNTRKYPLIKTLLDGTAKQVTVVCFPDKNISEKKAKKKPAVRAFLDRLDFRLYEFKGDETELLNFNTPEDLHHFPPSSFIS